MTPHDKASKRAPTLKEEMAADPERFPNVTYKEPEPGQPGELIFISRKLSGTGDESKSKSPRDKA